MIQVKTLTTIITETRQSPSWRLSQQQFYDELRISWCGEPMIYIAQLWLISGRWMKDKTVLFGRSPQLLFKMKTRIDLFFSISENFHGGFESPDGT